MTRRPRGPAVLELRGAGDARLLVAPRLGGRILTSVFGDGFETAWLDRDAIEHGHDGVKPFNNYGGQDRLWIGPEGGPHGYFFDPGTPIRGEHWRVPAAVDRGSFDVLKRGATYVRMRADLDLRNHLGFEFAIDVLRDVFLLTRRGVETAIDVKIPSWIDVTGSLSVQQLARAGRRPWGPRTGMPQLWILSQFPAGPRVTVFAPIAARVPARRDGRVKPFEDRYFGEPGPRRLWEAEPPHSERCVYFRADGKLRSKFGLRPAATTGLAGSLDADRGLLTLVKFDVRPRARYGSFLWRPTESELWRGDAFQAYNSGDGTFCELESVSPARPSSPGAPITHAHATCFLRGEPARLREFLYLTLDVTIPETPVPS